MTRYCDAYLAGIKAGASNDADDVAGALTALDGAIVALEDGALFNQVITSLTAGEALSERDAVYLASDSKWYQIDSDDTTPKLGRIRGFVVESGGIASGNTGSVRVLGQVSGFSGLTPWAMVYASTVAGGYTQTKPTVAAAGGQKALVPLGMAISATVILIEGHYPARYLKRELLADDGTITITHHADAATRSRKVDALVNTTVAGSSLTSYADTNQDEDVNLGDRTVASYTADQCSGGTASASSEASGTYAASKAFDDDSGTIWQSGADNEQWIQYDFGSGVTKTIRKLTMTSVNASYYDRTPRGFTLLASNTGSFGGEETTLLTVAETGAYWSQAETKTWEFSNSTAYRYYRINMTDKQGSFGVTNEFVIAEIEMMEASTYTDGNEKLAQSFQISADTVGIVKLWLKKVGSPTGNLTLTIETDSGGSPSGTPVTNGTSGTVAASTISTSYGWIEFTFSTAPSLSGSTTYWLVLDTSDSFSETNYVVWGADGSSPSYANGEMKSYASSTWSAESKDACFDVYGEGETYPEKASMGRWAGSNNDFGVRLSDTDGSDGDTKTSIKNLSGGTLDVTLVVEME